MLVAGACAGRLEAGHPAPELPAHAPLHTTAAPPLTAVVHNEPAPEDLARAKDLVARGEVYYRNGDYDKAESLIKQSMTLYPFLAEAHLVLGKVFLIRGSATRDRALIESARLMFEMARALDPSHREAAALLDLFRTTFDQ